MLLAFLMKTKQKYSPVVNEGQKNPKCTLIAANRISSTTSILKSLCS